MDPARFARTRSGRERLPPGSSMPRHRHACAYAAVVLDGGYVEAGDEGRRRVGPGDVLVHGIFDAHLDRIAPRGAEVLNLMLPADHRLPAAFRVGDPGLLVRAAEADPRSAAALLAGSVAGPGPTLLDDWPDLLAAALRARPDLRLAPWASAMGLAPATVSRGFGLAYGTTPRRYRAELRARRAFAALRTAAQPLGALALACGFADQAHMTRAVHAVTGAPPSAWRTAPSSRFKTGGGERG